jgi:hypothetical protein
VALAATTTHHHKHHVKPAKPKVEFVKCSWSVSTVPPSGQASVDQPPTSGDQYGPAACPALGNGMVWASFVVQDSGDTTGTYTQYFGAGTVSGSFVMSPNESPPISSTGFYSETWTGTAGLAKATGVYTGDKSKPGTGSINCSTADSGVHMTCVTRMRVVVPPPPATTTTTTGTTGPSGPSGATK